MATEHLVKGPVRLLTSGSRTRTCILSQLHRVQETSLTDLALKMISEQQKTALRINIQLESDNFMNALSAIDEQFLNVRPKNGGWTPAQVAVHIILATDGLPDKSTRKENRAPDLLVDRFRTWWEDLSQKFDAPEPLKPDDRAHTKQELLAELKRIRQKNINIASDKDLTEVCLDFELPTIGYMTRYEWLIFIAMHFKRHTFQLSNMVFI